MILIKNNKEDLQIKVDDHERISKYKNIFAKCYILNWSEEVFVIKKFKNTVSWTYVISDFNREETVGAFYQKKLQKTNQKLFRVKKVVKRKDDKRKATIVLLIGGLIKKT